MSQNSKCGRSYRIYDNDVFYSTLCLAPLWSLSHDVLFQRIWTVQQRFSVCALRVKLLLSLFLSNAFGWSRFIRQQQVKSVLKNVLICEGIDGFAITDLPTSLAHWGHWRIYESVNSVSSGNGCAALNLYLNQRWLVRKQAAILSWPLGALSVIATNMPIVVMEVMIHFNQHDVLACSVQNLWQLCM